MLVTLCWSLRLMLSAGVLEIFFTSHGSDSLEGLPFEFVFLFLFLSPSSPNVRPTQLARNWNCVYEWCSKRKCQRLKDLLFRKRELLCTSWTCHKSLWRQKNDNKLERKLEWQIQIVSVLFLSRLYFGHLFRDFAQLHRRLLTFQKLIFRTRRLKLFNQQRFSIINWTPIVFKLFAIAAKWFLCWFKANWAAAERLRNFTCNRKYFCSCFSV